MHFIERENADIIITA